MSLHDNVNKLVNQLFEAVHWNKLSESDFPVCPRLLIADNFVVNNVQFLEQSNHFALEDLNRSSGTMGIHFDLPVYVFLPLKVTVAIDLHYTNHRSDHGFSFKSSLLLYWRRRKDIWILNGLRVSKLTAKVSFLGPFGLNYPFNHSIIKTTKTTFICI